MAREYNRAQALSAEARMVEDIEELRPELQHAGLTKETKLRILDNRKVPIPLGRPDQEIAPGVAELAYVGRTIC